MPNFLGIKLFLEILKDQVETKSCVCIPTHTGMENGHFKATELCQSQQCIDKLLTLLLQKSFKKKPSSCYSRSLE